MTLKIKIALLLITLEQKKLLSSMAQGPKKLDELPLDIKNSKFILFFY